MSAFGKNSKWVDGKKKRNGMIFTTPESLRAGVRIVKYTSDNHRSETRPKTVRFFYREIGEQSPAPPGSREGFPPTDVGGVITTYVPTRGRHSDRPSSTGAVARIGEGTTENPRKSGRGQVTHLPLQRLRNDEAPTGRRPTGQCSADRSIIESTDYNNSRAT